MSWLTNLLVSQKTSNPLPSLCRRNRKNLYRPYRPSPQPHQGQIWQQPQFIRCDQFPVSPAHFLARLCKVIGAEIENPEDLTPLRPRLSSQEIFLVLDNAETILDPRGTNAQGIYAVVDELSRFKTISLLITSPITTVPRHCKCPVIPTLSEKAACAIFYSIYGESELSDTFNDLLQRLDFHALSITLLATVASHNM